MGNRLRNHYHGMARPALIKRWSDTSLFLLEHGRNDEALLMAWVSWEAYLERVVLLGLARQGLSIGDASNALRRYRNYGRGRGPDQALKGLFGVDPSSLRGRPGLVWRQLNGKPPKGGDRSGGVHSFRDRRNGLVHGSRSIRPVVARRGVGLIRDAVVDDEVFRNVAVRVEFGPRAGGMSPLGPVLRTVRPDVAPEVSADEVAEWLTGR